METRSIIIGWATNNKTTAHDRESFKGVLDNKERNEGVLLARNEKDPEKKKWLKSRQPAPMWNVDGCKDNIRSSQNAIPGPFYFTDYDRKDNPKLDDTRAYFMEHIYPHRKELHLVWAQISTGEGFHTVCQRPQNATIAQAQQWQSAITGLSHDPACHNEDRIAFLGHKDDVLYFDEEALFGEKELEPYTIEITEGGEVAINKEADFSVTQQMVEEVRAKKFFGVKFGSIFDAYVGTEKIPEGQRNTTVYDKAHKLMTLGLTTDELVVPFTTVSDLSIAELRQACRTHPNYVPSDGKLPLELRKVILQLREEAGLETDRKLLPCRPLPKKLPPLIRVLAAVAPKGMAIPLIILSLPILGFLATKVRMRYLDGVIHFLAFMAHVVGKFAGGKSTLIKWLISHLLEGIRERDELGRQMEREYAEKCRKCKADERKPDAPKPVIRYIPFTISIAQLLKRLDQAKGQHLLSVCDEVDTVMKTNKAGAWSEKTDVYRQAFDGGEYGQDYMSDNSYSGIFQVLYNTVSGGTDESTNKFFGKHVMDGYISRVAFTRILEEFASEMPKFKELTANQEAEIEEGIKTLEAAEGEIKLPRTLKAIYQWILEKRQLAIETMSPAIEALYKRSAVMGARAGGIATVLCGGKETNVVVEFALFIADYVLQQQVALWGHHFEEAESTAACSLANLYKELPEEFTRQELINLRVVNGQGTNVRTIIMRWKKAGMIRELGDNRYIKTQAKA